MRPHTLCRITLQIFTAACITAPPAAAQELALPPLADEVAAQFQTIGRLTDPEFTSQGCTATLIAPDLIVTAAHCASDDGLSARIFAAGWRRGAYIAARPFKREIRHPAYGSGGGHDPRNDVALIVLKTPIKDVTPIPLGDISEGALDGAQAALVGYHRKYPHGLSGDFACPVIRFAAGLLHVGCPVINGNSGGPLLIPAKDGGWQIVGVVSSRLGAGAIAVALPDWLRREVATHLTR